MTVSFPLHLILFAPLDHYCSHSESERPAWARAVSRPPRSRSSVSQEKGATISLYYRLQSEIFFNETQSNLTVAFPLSGPCWVIFSLSTHKHSERDYFVAAATSGHRQEISLCRSCYQRIPLRIFLCPILLISNSKKSDTGGGGA